ncbi:hypothetical protein OJAV_G00134840 [Oryzias javanicus]|uniref:YqaJ viral recombinase domain-containing protein n=1 Tax=Oryzias javanicus TaxID=123683 RepID=A0A3S2PFD1_ORYJA|nr:hypothetical protein OJAV_G00134840 [Oryzias javanicus]
MTMRNQSARQTPPPQNLVLPQVRYHPSIQVPAGKTWTRAATARPLQTRTDTGDVKGKRVTGRPDPDGRTRPAGETTPTAPALSHEPDPADGPSAKTSLRVRTSQTSRAGSTTGPSVRPDPDGEPEAAPPRPQHLPLDSKVHLDQDLVDQVEVQTRGQRLNEHWFAWRKNRITASVAHAIAHCRFVNDRSQTPPQSYLDAVTGDRPRVQTRAMSWGIQMEAEAVRKYQELKSAVLGRPVSVQECGLYIDPERSWLAASPDGIVTDSRTGQRLLSLEVKCPFKHRHRRVEDACRDDPAFCLQLQPGCPPRYHLKTTHSYFTQIQCQLAVTGLQQADLVVFTLQETAVVPVSFQPELWRETVSKLERFYSRAVLPHIRLQLQNRAGPAARTEP